MFQESPLRVGDRTLNVAVGPPAGPPLVLLHGVLRCWSDFAPLLPALASRWQVVGVDFRGHGASAPTPGRYRVIDYVQDALEVVDRRCQQPAVLLGHSLGGMVAAAVAAARPDRVRGIVLEDPPFATMGAGLRSSPLLSLFEGYRRCLEEVGQRDVVRLTDALAEIRITTPAQEDAVLLGALRDRTSLRFSAACLANIDPDVLTPIVEGRWLEEYELNTVVRQLACPMLLLQADDAAGGMLTGADAGRLQHAVRDCATIRFPNCGHLIHWTATEALLRAVTGWLESMRVEG